MNVKELISKGDRLKNEDRAKEALFYYQKAYALAPKDDDLLHSMGFVLGNLQRFSEAVTCFERALQINPNDPYIWNSKGRVHTDNGEYEQAVKCFNQSLKLDKNFSWPWNNLGFTMEKLGRYEEAFRFYEHALSLDPNYTLAQGNRRELLRRFPELGNKGFERESKRSSRNEQIKDPTLEKQMKQTRAELKEGDVLGGRYEIRKVIGKGGMGSVYIVYDKNIFKKLVALKSFKEEKSWDKETQEALKREAYTWVELGLHPNIVEAKLVQEFHGKVYIVMEYVDGGDLGDWIEKGRIDIPRALDFGIQFCNGMEYAAGAMKMVHRDIKPGNMLITKDGTLKVTDFGVATTTHHGEFGGLTLPYASPEQFLEAMGEQVKVDTKADIYSFGVVLYEMLTGRQPFYGRTEKEYITQHVKVNPKPPSSQNSRIPPKLDYLVMRCLEKDPNARYRAFGILKKALMTLYLEQTGKDYVLPELGVELGAWYWHNKALALYNLQRCEEAIICFDQALKISSHDEYAWSDKGGTLYNLQRCEEAIICFDQALKINPQHELAWNNKGLALDNLQRYDEAITCYDQALKINPQDEDAWSSKGNTLDNLQRYDEAITCYDQALQINPQDEYAWNSKGLTLENLNRYAEAITCYDQALKINPQFESAWFNKGDALRHLNRYAEAITCYDKALQINPQHEDAWNNKGSALDNLNRYAEAITCYDQALKINPQSEDAWFNKGNTLGDLEQYEKALWCNDRALEINPLNERAWTNKGWSLYLLKRYKEAAWCYDKALEINPQLEEAWYNKAVAYSALSDWRKAVLCYGKVLELNPANSEAKKWREQASRNLRGY